MRFVLLLLITATIASAQSDAGKLLVQGIQGALTGLTPVPEQDQAAVLKSTADLLAKHVTFRADDTVSAVCIVNGRQQVEWKRFVVRSIMAQPVTDADRLNGISKRCLASLSCEASRTWDAKKNTWDQWSLFGHVLFPSGITVEQTGGQWIARESDQIKWFSPGPGAAIAAPGPATKSDGLPPGMTRGR